MNDRKLGVICLAIWAILSGLLVLTNITFAAAPIVLALLLIAAGILLLLGR